MRADRLIALVLLLQARGRLTAEDLAAIEGAVGKEMAAGFTGQKPVRRALADAERRVNTLLSQVD